MSGEVLGYKVFVDHDRPDEYKRYMFDIAKHEMAHKLYDFLKSQPISTFELEEEINEGWLQDELILRVTATPVSFRQVEMWNPSYGFSCGVLPKESIITKIKRLVRRIL